MRQRFRSIKFGYIVSLFLSIYPVSHLFFRNFEVLNLAQVLLPFIIVITFSTLLYILFSIKIKEHYTKAIVVPLVVFVFFLYNHLHLYFSSQSNCFNLIGRNRVLIPLLIVLLSFTLFWVINSNLKVKKAILVFLVVLNLLPFLKLFTLKWTSSKKQVTPEYTLTRSNETKNLPDIFFIVLDMYPSNSSLIKYFGYDNSNFTNKLQKLGFSVFQESKSNYSRTLLSLTSILNMDYIHKDEDKPSNELTIKKLYSNLENGKVQSFLRNNGYNFYWFEGGYLPEKKKYDKNEIYITVADELFSRKESADNDFLMYFINNSVFSLFSDRIKILSDEIFRKRIENIFEFLPHLVKKNDTKFVFAHIMAPHPPFVFGENGEKVYFDDNNENRKAIFINQLKYINRRTLDVLEKMLNYDNGRNKIVIVLGDHGTRELIPNGDYSFKQDWAKEAFGNLNAIYFSDSIKNKKVVYHSPVNIFRFVFNQEFNQKNIYLEEKSYYTDFKFPLRLFRVTD